MQRTSCTAYCSLPGSNCSGYVPNLPSCIATPDIIEMIETEIRDAIRFDIEGLREDGYPVSDATSHTTWIEG